MSAPGTSIPALWFDHKGCGPSELALQVHPFDAEMDGAIPASLGLRIRAATEPEGGALIYGTAGPLIDSGFMLAREQVEDLHRQAGAWLAATATSPASSASDDEQPHVVNLTALAETRAKMTPGEYTVIEYDEYGPESALVVTSPSSHIALMADYQLNDSPDENAAGIVATHNAAPVLIEVARIAKLYADTRDSSAHQMLLDALAKVSL